MTLMLRLCGGTAFQNQTIMVNSTNNVNLARFTVPASGCSRAKALQERKPSLGGTGATQPMHERKAWPSSYQAPPPPPPRYNTIKRTFGGHSYAEGSLVSVATLNEARESCAESRPGITRDFHDYLTASTLLYVDNAAENAFVASNFCGTTCCWLALYAQFNGDERWADGRRQLVWKWDAPGWKYNSFGPDASLYSNWIGGSAPELTDGVVRYAVLLPSGLWGVADSKTLCVPVCKKESPVWISYGPSIYSLPQGGRVSSQNVGRAACEGLALGSALTWMDSALQNEFVRSSFCSAMCCWNGLVEENGYVNTPAMEQVWKWEHSQEVASYTNWKSGAPDNGGQNTDSSSDERFVYMEPDGTWDDRLNKLSICNAVCKKQDGKCDWTASQVFVGYKCPITLWEETATIVEATRRCDADASCLGLMLNATNGNILAHPFGGVGDGVGKWSGCGFSAPEGVTAIGNYVRVRTWTIVWKPTDCFGRYHRTAAGTSCLADTELGNNTECALAAVELGLSGDTVAYAGRFDFIPGGCAYDVNTNELFWSTGTGSILDAGYFAICKTLGEDPVARRLRVFTAVPTAAPTVAWEDGYTVTVDPAYAAVSDGDFATCVHTGGEGSMVERFIVKARLLGTDEGFRLDLLPGSYDIYAEGTTIKEYRYFDADGDTTAEEYRQYGFGFPLMSLFAAIGQPCRRHMDIGVNDSVVPCGQFVGRRAVLEIDPYDYPVSVPVYFRLADESPTDTSGEIVVSLTSRSPRFPPDARPWWRMDLGAFQRVEGVWLAGFGSDDGNSAPMADVWVVDANQENYKDGRLCANSVPIADTLPILGRDRSGLHVVNCMESITGSQIVVVPRPIHMALSICEVEVYTQPPQVASQISLQFSDYFDEICGPANITVEWSDDGDVWNYAWKAAANTTILEAQSAQWSWWERLVSLPFSATYDDAGVKEVKIPYLREKTSYDVFCWAVDAAGNGISRDLVTMEFPWSDTGREFPTETGDLTLYGARRLGSVNMLEAERRFSVGMQMMSSEQSLPQELRCTEWMRELMQCEEEIVINDNNAPELISNYLVRLETNVSRGDHSASWDLQLFDDGCKGRSSDMLGLLHCRIRCVLAAAVEMRQPVQTILSHSCLQPTCSERMWSNGARVTLEFVNISGKPGAEQALSCQAVDPWGNVATADIVKFNLPGGTVEQTPAPPAPPALTPFPPGGLPNSRPHTVLSPPAPAPEIWYPGDEEEEGTRAPAPWTIEAEGAVRTPERPTPSPSGDSGGGQRRRAPSYEDGSYAAPTYRPLVTTTTAFPEAEEKTPTEVEVTLVLGVSSQSEAQSMQLPGPLAALAAALRQVLGLREEDELHVIAAEVQRAAGSGRRLSEVAATLFPWEVHVQMKVTLWQRHNEAAALQKLETLTRPSAPGWFALAAALEEALYVELQARHQEGAAAFAPRFLGAHLPAPPAAAPGPGGPSGRGGKEARGDAAAGPAGGESADGDETAATCAFGVCSYWPLIFLAGAVFLVVVSILVGAVCVLKHQRREKKRRRSAVVGGPVERFPAKPASGKKASPEDPKKAWPAPPPREFLKYGTLAPPKPPSNEPPAAQPWVALDDDYEGRHNAKNADGDLKGSVTAVAPTICRVSLTPKAEAQRAPEHRRRTATPAPLAHAGRCGTPDISICSTGAGSGSAGSLSRPVSSSSSFASASALVLRPASTQGTQSTQSTQSAQRRRRQAAAEAAAAAGDDDEERPARAPAV